MNEKFDVWGVVEVMGRRSYAGRISEVTVAGAGMIRVDVPDCGPGKPEFSKLIGPGSVYAITPMTEDAARRMNSEFRRWSDDPILMQLTVPAIHRVVAGLGPGAHEADDGSDGGQDDAGDDDVGF